MGIRSCKADACDQTDCDPVHVLRAKSVVTQSRMKLGSTMPPIILDLIYREFMRARLAEMRKQLFLIRRDPEVDIDQPDSAADQGDSQHEHEAGHRAPR